MNITPKQEEIFGWIDLPLEEFMQETQRLLAEGLMEGAFWQEVLNSLEKKSAVKYMFLLYRMAEQELLEIVTAADTTEGNKQNLHIIGEMMESYVRTGRAFYEALYRPECFSENGICWMPADCRYNNILVKFLDGGKKEVKKLLEAAKLKPVMVPVIKAWLAELAEK